MSWRILIFLFILVCVLLLLFFFRRPSAQSSNTSWRQLNNFISDPFEEEDRQPEEESIPITVTTERRREVLTVDPLIEDDPDEYADSTEEEDPYEDEQYLNQRFTRIKEMIPHITQLRREWKTEKDTPGKGRLKLGQYICQRTLEIIFEPYEFPEVRPDFLRNPETGCKCELDCYCVELQLAVEFQGWQHREWPNQFPSMTKEKFLAQCRRDIFKTRVCREIEGIELLKVWDDTPYEDIPYDLACMIPPRFDPWRRDIYFVDEND